MTTLEIGQKLVSLCSTGQFHEAYVTLFADNATSIEPGGETATGLPALLGKQAWMMSENEFSDVVATGPYVGDNTFAVVLKVTMTVKATGATQPMEEVCLYTVEGDKIVEEKFLYRM